MIDLYFEAAIQQTRERARVLKTKIPRPIHHPEQLALQRLCDERLNGIIAELDFLLKDEVVREKKNLRQRIRLWRRCREDLSQVETTGIIALSRIHDDDIFLNRLVFQIHREINYPLPPPTACCLSREYFSINTSLHLLEVPPAEADFLLHLPDLYHELGHPLISALDDPKVEPYQDQLGRFLGLVTNYLQDERAANLRLTGPKEYHSQVLDLLERAWLPWSNELFCDLFALYTLGPAYAWAHFHLTATYGVDPFGASLMRFRSHPPDQARMEVMLIGLDLIGFRSDLAQIQTEWDLLIQTLGAAPTPTYRQSCPRHLLESAAIHALEGVRKIGCNIAGTNASGAICQLLNSAWQEFWTSPHLYHRWERQQIELLKSQSASTL